MFDCFKSLFTSCVRTLWLNCHPRVMLTFWAFIPKWDQLHPWYLAGKSFAQLITE